MRKFAKTLAVVGAITPAGVNALGLGEIRLHSALNQKFLAEIPILVSPDEDASHIRVNLAGPEAFAKAGLTRPYYLSNLRFKPIRKADGSVVIRVTSQEVIREPFLDFLLEVDWPQGRVLREFTVLLDPPSMLAEEVKPVQELPKTIPAQVERADAEQIPGGVEADDAQYKPVIRGESLWAIANGLKPPGVTTEQMAMALFKVNPEAFSQPNVNALKAGVTLRVPSREVVLELSPAQAKREFQQQYRAWLAQKDKPDSKPALTEEPTAVNQVQAPQLKLEPPELSPAQVETPSEEGTEVQATVESLKQENEALKSRIEALEKQVAALLEIKQAELAALQAKAEQAESSAQPPAPEAGGEAPATQVVPAQPATPAEVAAETKPVEEPAQRPELPKSASTPGSQAKPVAEAPSLFAELLDEPLYLTLGGGSLILFGIAGWMIRQRRRVATSQADSLLAEMDLATGLHAQVEDVDQPQTQAATPVDASGVEGVSSFLSEFTPSDFDLLEGESDAIDPLAEADVYLAYGRYNQAEELIRQALAEDPKRPELRLKLLEIFYAKEDAAAFSAYAQELKAEGADQDLDFWGKVADMGRELCASSPLFASDSVSAVAQAKVLGEREQNAWAEEPETATSMLPVSTKDQAEDDAYVLDFDLSDFDLEAAKKNTDAAKPAAFEEGDESVAFSLSLEDLGAKTAPSQTQSEFQLEQPVAEESFDLTDMDELDTKLDLARAYVDMEDADAAREILEDVFARGSEAQKQQARVLLDKLGLAS
ncbi:MAG: hypothetical protein N3A55_03190 [Methylohalobius sp.]|nr:hypothetical protein [Methylohalobius sp.]